MNSIASTNHIFAGLKSLLLVLFFVFPFAAHTAKTYSATDIKGTWKFNNIEIRWIPSHDSPDRRMNHCHVLGTAVSDGNGIAQSRSLNVCDITGTIEMNDTLHYSVLPDGQVTFFSEASGNTTHGQIVDQGGMILLDASNNTNPNLALQHGTAVRISKK